MTVGAGPLWYALLGSRGGLHSWPLAGDPGSSSLPFIPAATDRMELP